MRVWLFTLCINSCNCFIFYAFAKPQRSKDSPWVSKRKVQAGEMGSKGGEEEEKSEHTRA